MKDFSLLTTKQRVYALLLILGSSFLLYRTIHMVAGGSLAYLTWWVSGLLFMEMAFDLTWLVASVFWFRNNDPERDRLPLRLATAAIMPILGMAGVIIIWRIRVRKRKERQ